jgi:hypothetical protein
MKRVPFVILWAVAFAFVESSVVEYLRAIYYPINEGGFNFPLLTVEQLQFMGDDHVRRLFIELGREFATLVMLATAGVIAANNRRQAWAHFMIAFGIWDIFYYVWLKLFLNWPSSIMTWDLLFLLPVPWVAPVLAPVLISTGLVVSGLLVLLFEATDYPLNAQWSDWALITAGGLIVIVSFCLNYRPVMAGGLPVSFNWRLFLAGFLISAITFTFILFRRLTTRSRPSGDQ